MALEHSVALWQPIESAKRLARLHPNAPNRGQF